MPSVRFNEGQNETLYEEPDETLNENLDEKPDEKLDEKLDKTLNEKLEEKFDEKFDSLVDEVTITQQQDNSDNENKEKENITASTEPINDELEFHIDNKESTFEEVEPDDNVRDSLEE